MQRTTSSRASTAANAATEVELEHRNFVVRSEDSPICPPFGKDLKPGGLMHVTLSRILIAGIATAVLGCGDASMPTTMSAPSTLRADRGANDRTKTVRIMDECDPGTFNAVLGNGACLRNGGMTFAQFNAQLAKLQLVPGWRFSPDNVTLRVGDVLAATNFGGEHHTFTEVEDFGGGFVPALNAASGMTHVAPECAALSFADALAPGATFSETTDEPGDEKYQCCIHPWMRAIVHIAAK